MEIRATLANPPTAGTPPVAFDIDVSGWTSTPKAAVYELTGCIVTGTITNGYRYGVGITDGTTQRAQGVCVADNISGPGDQEAEHRHDNATVIQFPNAQTSALNGEANWTEWHAGGSEVSFDNLLGNAFDIKATYFSGDDIDVSVVEFTGSSVQNGSNSVTGLSFTPNFVYAISHYDPYAADSGGSHAKTAFGYAVRDVAGETKHLSFTDFVNDTTTNQDCSTIIRDDCLLSRVTSSVTSPRLKVLTWNSDGVTIQTLDASVAMSCALLIIGFKNGRRLWAGIPSVVTSSTGIKTISDPGFRPVAYFSIATDLASKNAVDRSTSPSKWSHGVYTGSESAFVGVQAEDDAITSDTRSLTNTGSIAFVVDDAGGTSWSASHSSFSDDGALISINDASSADRMVGFVFIGGTAVENETVEIEDDHVFHLTSTDPEAMIADESVAISDATVVSTYMVSDETVAISDASVAGISSMLTSEEEQISDAVYFAGTGVWAQADEEVRISDASQFVLGQVLTAGETVNIEDGFSFGAGLIPSKGGTSKGRTVQHGAERGRTIGPGSTRGGVA